MKKIFFAVIALTFFATACKPHNQQQGNYEKLERFHLQKKVK
ncbi:MAG: hypothetical protein ACJA0Q_000043 [Saprospiraceae bacterium]|jgi:hypothetical protein